MNPTPEQIHEVCAYQRARDCLKCTRHAEVSPYGRGTKGCYLVAEETILVVMRVMQVDHLQRREEMRHRFLGELCEAHRELEAALGAAFPNEIALIAEATRRLAKEEP